jgi:hypothetical protein
LGGPSLLIEKQRAAQQQLQQPPTARPAVPADIVERFGLDYPTDFGLTRDETIATHPLQFYTYVVRGLLEAHEPEKVRLLDKLLAKYVGREDHLVRKLAVRYRSDPDNKNHIEDHDDTEAFTDAVRKSKTSLAAEHAVKSAQERMQAVPEGVEYQEDHYQRKYNEWPDKEQKEPDMGDEQQHHDDDEEEMSGTESEYSRESVDGTSPAVIAQVSELLNYVYGKTSVPGQIDRVSTIMRAYEGREAVLLELLETKALIKANKEKENVDSLPSFLRNTQMAQRNVEELGVTNPSNDLPAVTPMATAPPSGGPGITDDISSMSGVSSPAAGGGSSGDRAVTTLSNFGNEEVEVKHVPVRKQDPIATLVPVKTSSYGANAPTLLASTTLETPSARTTATTTIKTPGGTSLGRPPTSTTTIASTATKKKKGLFGGLFGSKKKGKEGVSLANSNVTPGRNGSRSKGRFL